MHSCPSVLVLRFACCRTGAAPCFTAAEKDGAPVTSERSAPLPRSSVPHDRQPAIAARTDADQCPDDSGDTSALCHSETIPAGVVSLPPGESPKVVNGGPRAAVTVAMLTPLLLVHLMTVAVPMRFAYAILVRKVETDGEDGSFYKVGGVGGDACGAGACDPREQDVPGEQERHPNDGPTREVVDEGSGRSEESSGLLASSGLVADGEAAAADRPTEDNQVGSNVPPKGVSEEGGRTTSGVEAIPGAIRRNLGRPELGVKR